MLQQVYRRPASLIFDVLDGSISQCDFHTVTSTDTAYLCQDDYRWNNSQRHSALF
jgi:hypothetical protein